MNMEWESNSFQCSSEKKPIRQAINFFKDEDIFEKMPRKSDAKRSYKGRQWERHPKRLR